MIWLPFLLLTTLKVSQRTTTRCGNLVDAQTASITSSKGVTITLLAHGEDDHGKMTHLCQSGYRFAVQPSTNALPESDWDAGSDAEWDRKITFTLSGLGQNDDLAFGFISEGGRYAFFEVLTYDLHSGALGAQNIEHHAFRGMDAACMATLGVVGTSYRNAPVVGTIVTRNCKQSLSWEVLSETEAKGDHKVRLLPRSSTIHRLNFAPDLTIDKPE